MAKFRNTIAPSRVVAVAFFKLGFASVLSVVSLALIGASLWFILSGLFNSRLLMEWVYIFAACVVVALIMYTFAYFVTKKRDDVIKNIYRHAMSALDTPYMYNNDYGKELDLIKKVCKVSFISPLSSTVKSFSVQVNAVGLNLKDLENTMIFMETEHSRSKKNSKWLLDLDKLSTGWLFGEFVSEDSKDYESLATSMRYMKLVKEHLDYEFKSFATAKVEETNGEVKFTCSLLSDFSKRDLDKFEKELIEALHREVLVTMETPRELVIEEINESHSHVLKKKAANLMRSALASKKTSFSYSFTNPDDVLVVLSPKKDVIGFQFVYNVDNFPPEADFVLFSKMYKKFFDTKFSGDWKFVQKASDDYRVLGKKF